MNSPSPPQLLAAAAGHIQGGDERRSSGDAAGAGEAYRAAMTSATLAQQKGAPIPPALLADLRRAAQWLQDDARARMDQMEEALTKAGLPPAERSPLIGETLALLRGEVPIQLQRPKNLYVPGLPQRSFYERSEFAWAEQLECRTDSIAAEVHALLDADSGGFAPYLPEGSDRSGGTAPNAHLVGDSSWGAFYLMRGGHVAGNAERCPATMAALAEVPLPAIEGRSPMALFSLLKAGAHIRPHHGLFNYRLICHLPLIVPDGCSLRVGNHERRWRKGEMLIFDDSMEHEAWNRSDETRVILLFEIWRPEIGDEDRRALTLLLESSHIPATED
jgi:aspartyl/asparaginyl beta-hydroxylase (cupin superfamily)